MTIFHEPNPNRANWVYTHPLPESFNRRLLEAGTAALSERYDVTVTDLYSEGFKPALSPRDLGSAFGSSKHVTELTAAAYSAGEIDPQVRREQERLAASALLVLQFPLWWYGTPAVLKGWIDRVFQEGFSHGDMDEATGLPRRYGGGGLMRRRALIIVTAGDDARTLGPRGLSGDLESLLFPLTHGALWYVGIEPLALHFIPDADGLDAAGQQREASRLAERIRGLDDEAAPGYRRLSSGDYGRQTRTLRDDVHPGRRDLAIHCRER